MKVFVTGHAGYIGVHLVDLLKQHGHTVTGCDLYLFRGCHMEPFIRADKEIIKDVRELTVEDVKGHDCIIHLAAISSDSIGELDPGMTFSVNRDGSIHLARLAKQCGIERFLFSGSCSVYGNSGSNNFDENATLNPPSTYARSKAEAESAIRDMADEDFSPTFLRNAKAYGFSPMLRVDLIVNNLLAGAFSHGEIRILGDGRPWRPLIHARDIARAFVAVMNAPRVVVHNRAINIGDNHEDYRVKDIADKVEELIPDAEMVFADDTSTCRKDYHINFDLLYMLLPDFRLEYTLGSGMDELHQKFKDYNFSLSDFEGDRFFRVRTLKNRFDELSYAEEGISV